MSPERDLESVQSGSARAWCAKKHRGAARDRCAEGEGAAADDPSPALLRAALQLAGRLCRNEQRTLRGRSEERRDEDRDSVRPVVGRVDMALARIDERLPRSIAVLYTRVAIE